MRQPTGSFAKRRIERKEPLVLFAPLPPSKNGIADYVAELLPYQIPDFDLSLVIADDAPLPSLTDPGLRILFASEFRKHRSFFECVPKIYHIGNNPDHCYMLDLVARDPGTIVLHDYNLNYMHEMETLKWGEVSRYNAMMEMEYGALGRDILRWQLDREHREIFASYELPLNGDVLEAGTAVITHSRHVQYKVAARVPHMPVWYVPHHLSPTFTSYARMSKAAARAELGLPANELIITAPGFVTRAKQIPMILAALSELRSQVPAFRFVLAGERRPHEYDVDADIAAFGLGPQTICTDYVDEEQFFQHLAACDAVVNLRYPSAGEMSGTLIRALGMGKPTLILDCGPMAEMPDAAVKKIPWDSNAQASLTTALRDMMTDKSARLALGSRAAAYARNIHGIEKIAAQYAHIVRNTAQRQPVAMDKTRRHQYFAGPAATAQRILALGARAPELTTESDGLLWWRSGAPPLGESGRRALVVSPHPVPTAELLATAFGWAREDITAMTLEDFLAPTLREITGDPIPLAAFAFALVAIPAESSEERTALLMFRLNGAVCRGGSIALEVSHNLMEAEYERIRQPLSEARLVQCVSDAGFTSVRRVTPEHGFFSDLVISDPKTGPDLRYVCVTARKASNYAVWRYQESPNGMPMRIGGRIPGFAAS